MKNNTLILTVGALVTIAILIWLYDFIKNTYTKYNTKIPTTLLNQDLQFKIDKIKINRESDFITLKKTQDGIWLITPDKEDKKQFPANANKIAKLLDDLVRIKISSPVYNIDKNVDQTGLNTPTTIELWTQEHSVLKVDIGSRRYSGGQYIRLNNKGYLLNEVINNTSISEDDWELKKLFSLKKKQIKKLEFIKANAKTPLIIERNTPDEKLKITSKTQIKSISDTEVENLENTYEDISFSYKHDLNNHEAKSSFAKPHVANIYLFDGRVYNVLIGYIKKHNKKQNKNDVSYKYFIKVKVQKSSESLSSDEELNLNQLNDLMQKWYFEVYEYIAKKFIKTAKDFEKKINK